jgi:guanine deaminase
LIATGVNNVLAGNDPTAHAEVVAIRTACQKLGTFQLPGCDVYTSCEPCPMCLGAIYWARPERFYYGATREQAAQAGFDDAFIYGQIALAPADRSIPGFSISVEDAQRPFEEWARAAIKVPY